MRAPSEYFSELALPDVTEREAAFVECLRAALSEVSPAFLPPENATAVWASPYLSLAFRHADDRETTLYVMYGDGLLQLSCDGEHFFGWLDGPDLVALLREAMLRRVLVTTERRAGLMASRAIELPPGTLRSPTVLRTWYLPGCLLPPMPVMRNKHRRRLSFSHSPSLQDL